MCHESRLIMIIQGSSRRSVSDFLIYLHLNTSNHATVDVGCNSSLQDSVSTVSAFTEIKTFILHSVSNGAMDSLKYLGHNQLHCSCCIYNPPIRNTCITTSQQNKLKLVTLIRTVIVNTVNGFLLTLNSSKTEFLQIGLKQQLSKIQDCSLTTTHSARNLGFIFDEQLTFSDQITALSKSCYYHIRELRCIRPYLDFKTPFPPP